MFEVLYSSEETKNLNERKNCARYVRTKSTSDKFSDVPARRGR